MTSVTRIIVADDHSMVRAGLIEIINGFDGFRVVGEAGTCQSAVSLAAELQPDVVVLDLDMPGSSDSPWTKALTATEIFAACPASKIVVLTMYDDAATVQSLVRAGVSGYLAKSAGPSELLGALTSAARDECIVTVGVPRPTVLSMGIAASITCNPLTPRELEILMGVAGGSSNRHLSRDLHIAEATVKRHLDRIFKKLQVDSRMKAVNRARELHLL